MDYLGNRSSKCFTIINSGRVEAYGQLVPSFFISSGLRQDCLISPLLFKYAIGDVLQNASSVLLDGGVEFFPGTRVLNLE